MPMQNPGGFCGIKVRGASDKTLACHLSGLCEKGLKIARGIARLSVSGEIR
jgi:hypothetical protein